MPSLSLVYFPSQGPKYSDDLAELVIVAETVGRRPLCVVQWQSLDRLATKTSLAVDACDDAVRVVRPTDSTLRVRPAPFAPAEVKDQCGLSEAWRYYLVRDLFPVVELHDLDRVDRGPLNARYEVGKYPPVTVLLCGCNA